MFLRLVADSFTRRPRRKILSMAALAMGMAVATAALSVSLDVGDRLAKEFRSLGANLLVTPQADSLPLEIGGVDYRPANAGTYLPQADLGKLKTIFWRFNIMAFAPILETSVKVGNPASVTATSSAIPTTEVRILGTWAQHDVPIPDGSTYVTGIEKTNPWWHVEGRWFGDNAAECVVGRKLAKRLGVSVGSELTLFQPINASVDASNKHLKVVGLLETGSDEDEEIVAPLSLVQSLAGKPGMYRRLYVSALTKPEDAFARKDPKTMTPEEFDQWYCSPYISSIALQISEELKGTDVRVIRRVAEGEGNVLTHVRTLLWLVTFAALLAAALAVGASAAASVIERRTEIGLMKALGANSGLVGVLLAAEQLLLAFVGGGIGYAVGIVLARVLGERIFGFTPEPKLFVLLIILGLAALITLLGSAFPLRQASRYDPAPILRGE
ncbi:MAG TPA: ABC transporter permease [Candidatus Acidoferrales bacterium]|jgi:putative ABC transport system permease protein|nr:ABC transporter permease [Candidatus Acidoferrales bacterium]